MKRWDEAYGFGREWETFLVITAKNAIEIHKTHKCSLEIRRTFPKTFDFWKEKRDGRKEKQVIQ